MRKSHVVIAALVLLTLVAAAMAGCGGSPSDSSSPSGQSDSDSVSTDNAMQKANNAVRQANLKMIDSAIQAYYAENGAYPTAISQLAQYFARGVPVDPMGGTYYILTQGGVAKAAVR